MYEALISEILETLHKEVPEKYRYLVTEYELLIANEKFRASFYPLYKLSTLGDWHPSEKLKFLIDKYKVVL